MKVSTARVRELSVSSTEPVTTAYVKNHLRVDISTDDTLIGNLVTAARISCEKYCQRSFVQHTYRADLPDFWDTMVLPMGPVQSITSVKYYDTSSPSALQTLSSNIYRLFYDTVMRNYGASWVSVYPRSDAVQITYTTGWKDNSSPQGVGESCPESVKFAICCLVGDMYENREAKIQPISVQIQENDLVGRLLDQYRNYQ